MDGTDRCTPARRDPLSDAGRGAAFEPLPSLGFLALLRRAIEGWATVRQEQLQMAGEPARYASSEHAIRSFCGRCGIGLFYVNEHVLSPEPDFVRDRHL